MDRRWIAAGVLMAATLACRERPVAPTPAPAAPTEAPAGAEVPPRADGPAPPAPMAAGMAPIVDGALGPYWMDRYEYPNRAGERPLAYVDLATAEARCADEGKRLCTAAEWRRACLGPEGDRRYTYGPTYQRGRCHAQAELPSGYTSMTQVTPWLSPSGAHPGCASAEGVFDLVGNVEEWVRDDWNGLGGVVEGGAFYTLEWYADCTGRYSRQPDFRLDPAQAVFSAGFRCCWSAEAPSAEDVGRDARAQLAAAPRSEVAYDPGGEVAIGPATFIDRYEYPNVKGAWPRTGVSWGEARQACEAAGKRLCTSGEWQVACGGEEGLAHPYGEVYRPGACAVMEDAPTASGAHPACQAPSGALDLVGGVWEWTSSALALPERGHAGMGDLYEVRGGAWSMDELKGRCRPVEGYPAAPERARYPDVGFRCCRGPELGVKVAAPAPRPVGRCPGDMAWAGGVCIDRYEAPGKAGEVPTGGLSLEAARDLCLGRGKRLCTGEEWERACAGPEGRRWPYGDTYDPERCTMGVNARATGAGRQAPAGSKVGCVTPEGVFDLSGNLWEWTEDAPGQGALRGGGWNVNSGLGQCGFTAKAAGDFSAAEVGARCCVEPE